MRTKEEVIQEVLLKNQSQQISKEIDVVYFKTIIGEAKKYHLCDELVHIYCNQANIYFIGLGNFNQAKKALNKCKSIFKKGSSEEVIARHYIIWANIYRLEANFPMAIQCANNSLKIISRLNSNKTSYYPKIRVYYIHYFSIYFY